MERKERIKSIVPFCLILIALTAVGIRWGKSIVNLVADPEAFRLWVNRQGVWGPLVMIGSIALQILVAVIPGEPFESAAGYAFGAWQGLLLCMIGSFIGSCVAMLLARKFGVRLVRALFPKNDLSKFSLLNQPDRLRFLTFILFLIPGTPKDFMIYALGLTPMGVFEGVALTCIARIPSIITSTLSGHALGEKQYAAAIIIYSLTAVVSLTAWLWYRKKSRTDSSAS